MVSTRFRSRLAIALAVLAIAAHFAPIAWDRSFHAFRSPGAEQLTLWVGVLIPALVIVSFATSTRSPATWPWRVLYASLAIVAVAMYSLGDVTYSFGSDDAAALEHWAAWRWAEYVSVAVANALVLHLAIVVMTAGAPWTARKVMLRFIPPFVVAAFGAVPPVLWFIYLPAVTTFHWLVMASGVATFVAGGFAVHRAIVLTRSPGSVLESTSAH